MALINEKDGKVIRERLSKLPGRVKLAIFIQDFECEYCQQTRELAEEVAALSEGTVTTEVYDLVVDKAKADQMGIDKTPALGRGTCTRRWWKPRSFPISRTSTRFPVSRTRSSATAPRP